MRLSRSRGSSPFALRSERFTTIGGGEDDDEDGAATSHALVLFLCPMITSCSAGDSSERSIESWRDI